MALLGSLSTVRAQLVASPAFDLALDYVARALSAGSPEAARIAAVPMGETVRVELGEGVFALEQAYLSKAPETGKWEAHEKHIDVQVVVSGRELMEFAEVNGLTLTEDYRAERDLMFYAPFEEGSVFKAGPGAVAVFFPADAHRPSLADGASAPVRKTVVKVPVSAVSRRA